MTPSTLSLLLLVVATTRSAEAFVVSSRSSSAFVGGSHQVLDAARRYDLSVGSSSSSTLCMDLEQDTMDVKARYKMEQTLRQHCTPIQTTRSTTTSRRRQPYDAATTSPTTTTTTSSPPSTTRLSVEQAQAAHGMPWKTSIDPKAFSSSEEELLYMPFWEWQLQFMQDHLTNLRVEPCTASSSSSTTDFGYQENTAKKARIVNLCFSSQEYRKIRMTYYDAGDNTQVFNAVWYPDPAYNLPILGIDLLAFNRKKYLAIVDFQPLHETENQHAANYEHILQPIKEQYPALKGRMSSKFYDETQFFSNQMLFARFENEQVIKQELFPAFQGYVQAHLDLLQDTNANDQQVDWVLKRQEAYDTYSAERDPATGLFTAMFGHEWAQDFVHDFLFSLSQRPDVTTTAARPSFVGGGGPPPLSSSVPSPRQPSSSQHYHGAVTTTTR